MTLTYKNDVFNPSVKMSRIAQIQTRLTRIFLVTKKAGDVTVLATSARAYMSIVDQLRKGFLKGDEARRQYLREGQDGR
jgi:hypothetical protein